ncbi:MAG: DUF1178 family protein [Sphingomicrobium sp.]
MIVFDLRCLQSGDRFEAWFRSNADYERQLEQGLVQCPTCQSIQVTKAPMAPQVPRKCDAGHGIGKAIVQIASRQAELLRNSTWVGEEFADTARAMHLGEMDATLVHGEATMDQVQSLVKDGVPVSPLPLPVVPPHQVN